MRRELAAPIRAAHRETRRTARRAHMALIVSSQTAQAAHTAINSRQEAVREMRRAHRRRNL